MEEAPAGSTCAKCGERDVGPRLVLCPDCKAKLAENLDNFWRDFRQVTATALAASFLPEEVKADVRDRHLAWVTDPGIPSRFP